MGQASASEPGIPISETLLDRAPARAAGGIILSSVCSARLNTPKEALVISVVGLVITAFTGFSILRALKARRWQLTSGTILESDIERIGDGSAGNSKLK